MSENKSKLKDEIKQTIPFTTFSEEGALGILRTSDVLRRRMSSIVQPFSITLQQYNVLRILRGAGKRGLPTLEISERMVEETPGITRILDRLERKKLIHRERSQNDRRRVYSTLTKQGELVLKKLDEPMARGDGGYLKMLTRKEQKQLIELLDKIRAKV